MKLLEYVNSSFARQASFFSPPADASDPLCFRCSEEHGHDTSMMWELAMYKSELPCCICQKVDGGARWLIVLPERLRIIDEGDLVITSV